MQNDKKKHDEYKEQNKEFFDVIRQVIAEREKSLSHTDLDRFSAEVMERIRAQTEGRPYTPQKHQNLDALTEQEIDQAIKKWTREVQTSREQDRPRQQGK
jgi:hypothetical protein